VEWVVRHARGEDAEGVVHAHERASEELFERVVGKRLDALLPFEARLAQFNASIVKMSPRAQVLVAESDGEIIGLAVCVRPGDGPGELKDLHVVPEAWGSGVSRGLMAAALDALRGMGTADVFLWVGEDNPRARRFYEREGWQHDGASQPSSLGPVELRYTKSFRDSQPE
jgi:GNAT superfamily N-acetyltransferase